MWKLKLRVYDENGTFAGIAKKYKTSIQGYMINYYNEKDYFYFNLAIFLNCNEELKKKILSELTQIKRVNKFEDQGNFIICELKVSEKIEKSQKPSLFYNPALIQVKPFFIDENGWEELELASFERKPLEKILEISDRKYQLKLIYFKEDKIKSFGVVKLFPELTKRQREILDLAIQNEYYSYPEKRM